MPTLAKESSQLTVGVGGYRIQLSWHVTHTTNTKPLASQYNACTRPSGSNTNPLFLLSLKKNCQNSKDDGKSGQHFNLTQILSGVEIDKFGFSFDYQITIFF